MNLPGRGNRRIPPIARLFSRQKDTKFPGENAGWAATRTSATGRLGGLPRRLADYMGTYGGTADSITWVYACVSLIASEAASYPYEIIEEDGEIVPEGQVDNDLQSLLDFPNPGTTYFDFVEYTMMDLELAGNSYWIKDQRNGLGQPLALYRMRPDLVQVATDNQGKVVGYVYSLEGQQIPFDLDEVLRFMYPNPLDDRYGMGTVEAIQRALGAELAETEHINGFFSDGARISGILTTADNLSDLQFERLRSEFEAQFKQGGSNNFGVLIAEQGTGYTPLSSVPASSGVTELRSMGKDEILSGFGVPEFLLGGAGQGGIYRMSEAQHIFTRNMKPRSRRFSERMTMQLVSLWEGMEFRQDVTVAEASETKLQNARSLLGMGASLNQVLDQAGLPPIDDEQADEPLITQGILPFSIAIQQAQAQLPPPGGGQDPFGGQPAPFDPYGGGQDYGLGNGGGQFGAGQGSFDDQLNSFVSGRRGVLKASRPRQLKPAKIWHPQPKQIKAASTDFSVPELPPGFEKFTHAKAAHAEQATMEHILEHHARVLKNGYPDMLSMIREFFVEQRKRIIANLPKAEKRPGTSHMRWPRKDISMNKLWDDDVETTALLEAYLAAADEIAEKAVDAGRIVGATLSWDVQNPFIAAAREELASQIVGINEKTREKVAAVVEEGMRSGYSVPQIANGFEQENYPGITGVFDQASAARAETIARTETAKIYNAAANASYEAAGVTHVEVIDGDGDEECKAANGQRWTLEHAQTNPVQHPNCVRSFVPIVSSKALVVADTKMRRDVPFVEADHPRDAHGQFARIPGGVTLHDPPSPVGAPPRSILDDIKGTVDDLDDSFGVVTKGTTLERFKTWCSVFTAIAAILAAKVATSVTDTDAWLGAFNTTLVKLNSYAEELENRRLGPNDWFDLQITLKDAAHMAEEHHEVITELFDEAYVMAVEGMHTLTEMGVGPHIQTLADMFKNTGEIEVKRTSVVGLLPNGLPDPNFVEREHPRGRGGRFEDKPDVPDIPHAARPKPKPPRARIGSRADLELLGVPTDVIDKIEELGLDENLKNRKKGETAKKLLGSHADTKALHTDKRTGAYSMKRKELHDKIVDLFLREKKPVWDEEKGRIEWVPDENGEYVASPEVMKQRFTDRIAEMDRKLANPEVGQDEGKLRAERDAYRDALKRTPNRKTALFLAGGNASGKSTALYSAENQDVMKPDASNVEVNFDLIKERLPEFQQMAAAHDIYGTDGTHFESADIARRLLQEARQRGASTIVDASGDSSTTGFLDTIKDSKSQGYDTEVLMVDAPVEIALRDSIKRALRTGRYIPAPVLRRIHANSVARMDEWKSDPAVDKWQVYRRTDDGVQKAAEGGKGEVNIVNPQAFSAILKKAQDAAPLKVAAGARMKTTPSPAKIQPGTPVADPDSPGAVHVGNDVVKAAKLIADGVPVELDQTRTVSTLIDKLAELVEDAVNRGEKAPVYDLCKVTVKGTNLFCVNTKGIPRIKMPQLKGVPEPGSRAGAMTPDKRGEVDVTEQFKQHLAAKGIKIHSDQEYASYLKATQNELDGAKVAGIAKYLEGGGIIEGPGLMVSRDNYIVDGHHRWAAVVANDARDNNLENDPKMDVDVVDLDIIRLLKEANDFAADWGLPQVAVGAPMGTEKPKKS